MSPADPVSALDPAPTADALDKVIPLERVPDFVEDGSSLFIGGFTLFKSPLGLVRELARSRPKELTVWQHIGGPGVEILLAVDAVAHVRASYVGLDIVGFAPLFTRRVQEATIGYTEETEATMMFGMKATQWRLPFMPARALVGSEIVEVRDDLQEYDCQISGERLVALPPVSADVCFLQAQKADRLGNVQMYGTMGNDIELAKVSSRVVVSVEELVETEELLKEPEKTKLPGHLVDAVVHLEGGAYPSSCLPYYDVDFQYFLDYVDAVRDGRLEEYVATHIDGDPFPAYRAARGG
jgi:glutaconate CoA-transferase subunit A